MMARSGWIREAPSTCTLHPPSVVRVLRELTYYLPECPHRGATGSGLYNIGR